MTQRMCKRIRIIKKVLRKRIMTLKAASYDKAIAGITTRELAEIVRATAPGTAFTNVARDIRSFTTAGVDYDAELDLLWRGQILPEIIERYSEKLLATLIKGVVAPDDLDAALCAYRKTLPGGKRPWQEV